MTFAKISFRTIAASAVMLSAISSANALTIGTASLAANSIQGFSQAALDQYEVLSIAVTPLGNATALATPGAYNLPVTSITINSQLKVVSGSAKGSALEISRIYRGNKVGFTIANFTIDYLKKQVLADLTPIGGTTVAQTAIYNFNVATPLGLKYKFPLSITGHEVLDQLFLTEETQAAFFAGLKLPNFALGLLKETDFGTITQDIKVALRKAVSTQAYVPAQ